MKALEALGSVLLIIGLVAVSACPIFMLVGVWTDVRFVLTGVCLLIGGFISCLLGATFFKASAS